MSSSELSLLRETKHYLDQVIGAPLSNLCSGLVSVNLSQNEIDDIDEVCSLNRLPMLQSVELVGNPLTNEPDYRSQILGRIPTRINDLVVSINLKISQFPVQILTEHIELICSFESTLFFMSICSIIIPSRN